MTYQVTIYRLSAIGYNIEILVLCCYAYTVSSSSDSTIFVQYQWPVNMAAMVNAAEISHSVCWGSVWMSLCCVDNN
jgi:hypothetical protein